MNPIVFIIFSLIAFFCFSTGIQTGKDICRSNSSECVSKEVKDLKTAQVVCLEDWRLQHFIAFSKQHQHIKTTTLKLVETETPLGEIQHG